MSSPVPAPAGLDAVILGAAAMDLLAWVERLPEKDAIVLARRFEMQPGGSGANVAVALSRLGLRTGFIARLSSDANGQVLRQAFLDEGVDIGACHVVEDQPTAQCFITIDQSGDRSMVALGGAGSVESLDELALEYLSGARLIYLTDVKPALIESIAAIAQEHGQILVLSPGGLTSSCGISNLSQILSKPDLWLLSSREALDLLPGCSAELIASQLCELGARSAVVTLGSQGISFAAAGRSVLIPALAATQVVDTTGAGDAFAGGLLAGILLDRPMEESLRLGLAAASLKIAHAGARSGLPRMAEVEELLAGSSLS